MADVLALVSKGVFDKVARDLGPDDVWPTAGYASAGKGLAPLAEGGRLFLVTVRQPNERLWLVAVLDKPRFDGKGWSGKPNKLAIRDISTIKGDLRFASGVGLPTKAGVLGMSLQTPRVLTETDAKLLLASRPVAAMKAVPAKVERVRKPKPKAPIAIDDRALLVAWRRTRAPELAAILCSVELDAEWPTGLPDANRKAIRKLTDRIARLPDDPRTTDNLLACVRSAKWPGSSATPIWRAVFRKLVALRDPRAIEPLRAMVEKRPHFLGAEFTNWCVGQIAETAATLAKQKRPKLDAAAKQLIVDAPVAAAPAKRGDPDALVAQVWAAPDDLALRGVIGDALLELEDPWGELIALQVGGAKATAAVKTLIRKHGVRFAGGITHLCARDRMTFEHGFLATCRIGRQMVGRRYWEECAAAPQWATVREVEFTLDDVPKWFFATYFATANLASLRTIELGSVTLARTSAAGPWRFVDPPSRLVFGVKRTLEFLLRGLPPAELARIPATKSPAIAALIASITAPPAPRARVRASRRA